ncbi:OmpP1/FadL family transporter [Pararhizobium antarcticum]|uniref:Long-chain fatty acid transporter n=1 Tax=Pararhizobium antarcticum TaxID=1798805 RepID=A0A657LK53_9HYPH|nr:OmpP1/FadL family transporter [Pararhizobium antarcticum]OJF89960.1 long-chain fatty acid transporter [Pararhizobium antarcticum]OJF93207.1 long-chain fatty acid transporter [Rhizobium sp. 58]
MAHLKIKATLVAALATTLLASAAHAGGLERGGYNIDLLFDPSTYAAEAAATYVNPQRELNNVNDMPGVDGDLNDLGYSSSADETEGYWVPRVGVKAGIGDAVDCIADYSQPFGAHTNPGANWAGANDNVETKVNSDNYAVTCSYSFDMGPGQFRVIGGGSYLEMDGFKERLVVNPFAIANLGLTGTGIGRLDLAGEGWGWRAGAAYEVPEYAFRASLVYYSEVRLDEVTGAVDLTQVPALLGGGGIIPVSGATAMPDSIELKVQSGIAPDWLAFGSVKWVDWSQLQRIPFYNGGVEITSLDLGYRDGWTITGGVGHKFSEKLSGALSVTWDRGTSKGYGTQTDTWTLGTGVSYNPTENVEFRLAGAVGILTSGSSGPITIEGVTVGNRATYDFDNDLVTAISTSVKIKF